MNRIFVALVVGFIFLVPMAGWSAQPSGTLPEQVASLAAQVAELQGQVANLTTQLNKEIAARQAALIPMDPSVGMDFNDLYRQAVQAGCGWLVMESRKDDLTVYHVALSNPGCNQKTLYSFKDDHLVKIE